MYLLHSSRRLQRVTVEPRRARFEHERASLASINPPAACNLVIAATLPPRDRHQSMPGSSECSNVGFLVSRSSGFQSAAALATPIDLHLHMVSLALVRQEHELARSARNAGTFNFGSLKHPLPDTMQAGEFNLYAIAHTGRCQSDLYRQGLQTRSTVANATMHPLRLTF
jgi:hypothetical protein